MKMNQTQVAERVGVSVSRIRMLTKQGRLTRDEDKKYDVAAVDALYASFDPAARRNGKHANGQKPETPDDIRLREGNQHLAVITAQPHSSKKAVDGVRRAIKALPAIYNVPLIAGRMDDTENCDILEESIVILRAIAGDMVTLPASDHRQRDTWTGWIVDPDTVDFLSDVRQNYLWDLGTLPHTGWQADIVLSRMADCITDNVAYGTADESSEIWNATHAMRALSPFAKGV